MGRTGSREEYVVLAEQEGIDFSKEMSMLSLSERTILTNLAVKFGYKTPKNNSRACGFFLLLKKTKNK